MRELNRRVQDVQKYWSALILSELYSQVEAYTVVVGGPGAGRAVARLVLPWQDWALGSDSPSRCPWPEAPTHWGWRRRRRWGRGWAPAAGRSTESGTETHTDNEELILALFSYRRWLKHLHRVGTVIIYKVYMNVVIWHLRLLYRSFFFFSPKMFASRKQFTIHSFYSLSVPLIIYFCYFLYVLVLISVLVLLQQLNFPAVDQ